jgi:hypothetical protein
LNFASHGILMEYNNISFVIIGKAEGKLEKAKSEEI